MHQSLFVSMKRRCAGIPVVLFMLVACNERSAETQVTDVELDAFSGRPNPRWTMPHELSTDLWAQILSLPPADSVEEPGHLGYRGFVLKRGTTEVRVYKGRIWINDRGEKRIVRDSSGIEASLIDDARARGFGALVR